MLSGLLRKLKSLLGLGETDGTAGSDETTAAASSERQADYECAVCGTPVEEPDGQCPLCRSTDVVAAGETDAGTAEGTPADRLAGGATEARSGESADAAADRLRELREEQEQGQEQGQGERQEREDDA